MKKRSIIVDLDGTIADISVRQRFLEGKKDWKSFNASVDADTLNLWCREIIEHMREDFSIIIVSGRTSSLEKETVRWLKKNRVHYDELYLREEDDFRPDQVIKKEIYETYIQPTREVLFVLDDRSKVVKMWRSLGLICLQCDEGNY